MKKRPFLILSGLIILCMAAMSWFLLSQDSKEGHLGDTNIQKKFANLYLFEGTFTHFEKGERVFTFEADEVVHRKKKFGPLTINPIKELELTNVRIELHDMNYLNSVNTHNSNTHSPMHDTKTVRLPLGQIFQSTFGDMQLGFVARIIIDGLTMEADQLGKKLFTLFANKAEFGMDRSDITFEEGFSLTGENGQQLVTQYVEWQDKKAEFFIPGVFVLKKGNQEHASSNAYFSLLTSGEILQKMNERNN